MEDFNKLINKVLKGNEKAAKEIYTQYLPYVYTIILRYNVNEADRKDLTQEIFSNAFQSLSRYDASIGEFKYWIRRIAVNHILKQFNKKKIAFEELEYEKVDAYDTNISDMNFNIKDIMKVLEKMPAKFAIVFNLFVIDGYSNIEISKKLNLNQNTVRSYIKRGRDWAKQALQEAFDNEMKYINQTNSNYGQV